MEDYDVVKIERGRCACCNASYGDLLETHHLQIVGNYSDCLCNVDSLYEQLNIDALSA